MKSITFPVAIIDIVLLFAYNTLDTSLLTSKEEHQLLELFRSNNKFREFDGQYLFELIYYASKHGLDEKSFKSHCHFKKNLLCIIINDKENVFGGYTSIGWQGTDSDYNLDSRHDEEAFLFKLKCGNDPNETPQIFNVTNPAKALRIQGGFFCMFGQDCTFYIYKENDYEWIRAQSKYYQQWPYDYYLTNGNDGKIVDIEVYQLDKL